ncbi:MAG TPA: STAS domain-containing protein [Terriglobales bacterium]|nr:STAS domain-containing protein [Terriglobales bacterium]
MKLNVTIRAQNDVVVVYCKGRIVYRDEATALSDRIAQLLPDARKLILDLSCVEMIDSAGLGELVVLYIWAQAKGSSIKLAAPDKRVRHLLELTNLASVFPIHSTLDEAMHSWHGQAA